MMTATTPEVTATASDVIAATAELVPEIRARAEEVEVARRLPADLLAQLVRAGCFRVLLPTTNSGSGADLPSALRVFETAASGDASVGWTVMIGATGWCDLIGLPRATFDELFPRDRDDVIVAGAFNPTGARIAAVDGGFSVTGRWSFASGCEHATWLWGNCVEGVVNGVPSMRAAVFDPEQVTIEDTWYVSGLSGTGSHHFRVDGVVVPSDRTYTPMTDQPCLDEPISRIPPPALFALSIASVAVGVAQGALDDVAELAADKMPLLSPSALAANSLFHVDFATAHTEVRAARALLEDTAEGLWADVAEGSPLTLDARARVRAAAVWITERAVGVVSAAYHAGGGTSLYTHSPLQRRLRDIHALTQHFLVRRDTLQTAGAIFAGQDVHPPVF